MGSAKHVLELPDYRSRDYLLLTDRLELLDYKNGDGTMKKGWLIEAPNANNPKDRVLPLFVQQETKTYRGSYAVTDKLCPSVEETARPEQICSAVTRKRPFDDQP